MSLQDPIADMLTRIRNAQMRQLKSVAMPTSKMKNDIANVLLNEGFIESFEEVSEQSSLTKTLHIKLKYHKGNPVIKEIKRVSKSSLRQYVGAKDIPLIKGGLGLVIMTTSKGIVSGKTAQGLNVGGEIICSVY